ncbi:MFS transporter [Xenorhabdus bovienii]|uniref:Putative transport system membrane protein n=1 Tax=Xenorhabdus bovienii str. feltiae Moldova TaxID=1398200 RepID=A0A077NRT5_XENBV|nr:MFS transporter [Xenorhabdus bovienii]CDH01565.1 putative transport system membrane protein [Xenorhabdus bovienii str. feltiae Moldova]
MTIWVDIKEFPLSTKKVLFVQWLTTMGSFAVIPFLVIFLVQHKHLSIEFSTFQLSLFLAGQYGATFIGGVMSDKLSSNMTMKCGLSVQIFCYLIFLFNISTPWIICVLSIGIGIGRGLFTPAAKTLVTLLSKESNKVLLFSFRSTINNIGVALGSAIGGFFMNIDSALFFGIASASQLIALLILYFLPNPHKIHTVLNVPSLRKNNNGAIGYLITNIPFIMVCLFYILFNFIYTQLQSTFPLFASYHWGALSVSALFIMNAVIVILFQVLINVWLNKWFSPWLSMCFGFLAFFVTFLAIGITKELGFFIILIAFFTFGEITIEPTIDAVTSSNISTKWLGSAFGVLGITGLIGSVTGNSIAGHFLRIDINNPQNLWMICMIISLIGVFFALFSFLKRKNANSIKIN